MSKNHALVFGASGISGWAICREALSYPSSNAFESVTGLTNRPLTLEDAYLPEDARLQLVSGIDLSGSVESVTASVKEKIKNISSVTHIFFTAYSDPGKGYQALKEVNTKLVQSALEAFVPLTPHLKSFILQTGGKAYGVEFHDKPEISENYVPPLSESLPRIPEPYASNVFYYSQYDVVQSFAKSHNFTFTEVRPDVIVGYNPTTNFMSAALGIALYLSLYRIVHGANAKIPFPGTPAAYKSLTTDTFQDILARFSIHAALNSDKCGDGRSFNIADASKPGNWESKWAGVCKYFDLQAEGPSEDGQYQPIEKFVQEHKDKWDKVVQEKGLRMGRLEGYVWVFVDAVMGKVNFDRQYDLSAARGVGFTEEIDTVQSYTISFDRFREGKVIP